MSLSSEALYKSRRVVLAQLRQRGFDTANYEGSSVAEVNLMQQTKQLDMLVTKGGGSAEKVYVKYHIGKSLRAQTLYDYIEDLFELEQMLGKDDELIVIVRDEPNDSIRQTLRNIWATDRVFVTVLQIGRTLFNVLEHKLVPPHTVLSEEAKAALFEKYGIRDESGIPDISRFSPPAMAIGLRPGQVCSIVRPSRTAVTALFYRICSA